LYNNGGLISKGSEDKVSEISKSLKIAISATLRFDAPTSGNPANIRINLIVRVRKIHFVTHSIDVFIENFVVGSKRKRTHFETECVTVITVQGHPR